MAALESRGYLEVTRYGRKASPQFRLALPAYAYTAIDQWRERLKADEI